MPIAPPRRESTLPSWYLYAPMHPLPQPGQVVHCRTRRYLVEEVTPRTDVGENTLVRMACLDDDAQGQPLSVLWEREVDARALPDVRWDGVVARGFEEPRWFSAFFHTVRWNSVTSTNPKLFQSPYRAGIEVKAYQLEPLRKALAMPRVNLFIADDVGLGKTIEAGLVVRELLMRQRIRRVVIAAPPSVTRQWQEEMEQRFGLTFVVYDREFVAQRRRERGYGVNAWTTHSRFIISHSLIREEDYLGPLREWLKDENGGSAMLILDEAHNAAPSSGQKYAVDSKLTGALRDVVEHFDHRLFLSATPHNGHSNSFAALLALLDPNRFCRGVPVTDSPADRKLLDQVMVRRLKQDLRGVANEKFPLRTVVPVVIDGLAPDAPDLELSRLLARYRRLREARLALLGKGARVAGLLVLTSLQKRLLSSVEAFARTLAVHRRAVEKADAAAEPARPPPVKAESLLIAMPDGDDDRAELPESQVEQEDDAEVESATLCAGRTTPEERDLLDRMTALAQAARRQTDPRVERFLKWVDAQLRPDGQWNDRRVLVFTEYIATKRYLENQLAARYGDAETRVGSFHGGMSEAQRAGIKSAFNGSPADFPLRILIATDAAREGVNLQNHCADLFHFDVPWNPGRMEQRNGRIDRKLQQADEVRCYYFVLKQRPEDLVLAALVEKTKRIGKELGVIAPVIVRALDKLLEDGIRHEDAARICQEIEDVDRIGQAAERARTVASELESGRERATALTRQIAELEKMLGTAKEWIGLNPRHFRDALSASLELLGVSGMICEAPDEDGDGGGQWRLPDLSALAASDPSWQGTLDTLRPPMKPGELPWEWRRKSPIRPVVFRDSGRIDPDRVHLHLEHRVVQRLLGRFLAQGFVHDELKRACVVLTEEPTPKVVLLGRLSMYGERAVRLHDTAVASVAEWVAPEHRRGKLAPLGETDKADVLELVERSFASQRLLDVSEGIKARLLAGAVADVDQLLPALRARARELERRAQRDLTERGEREAVEIVDVLQGQRERVEARIAEIERGERHPDPQQRLAFAGLEEKQFRSDLRHLRARIGQIEAQKQAEPARIRKSYVVTASRIEPIGLVYLWPVSS